ncbi:MAG: dihydrodipicolinate reductase [Acidobacteria bacterium]|nr:dihydrodipicolinate reductase [Acidobacteriota bacterium]
MRILVIGHGRMGQLVEKLAGEHGCEVAGIADLEPSLPVALTTAGSVDVAIDFSQPDAVFANVSALAARRVNVVVGTTGWQAHEPALRRIADEAGIGVLASANFSIGMQVFRRLVEQAARMCAPLDVGAWIHEKHHDRKKDAPSGTALLLKAAMEAGGYARPVDVSATRAGYIPGQHEVGFDGVSETVTLTHVVRDRAVFAHGALEAAKWLNGRRGWFTMQDMIGS